jgi:hypothetical protein
MDYFRRYALIAAVAGAGLLFAAPQPANGPAIEVLAPGPFGALQLVNHGQSIRLSAVLKVEQQLGNDWKDTPVTNLFLIAQCGAAPVPKCVSLPAGATFQPVPWRGNYCNSQCPVPCDLDGPVPPGVYRFVVSTCDHKRKFVSPTFEKK